MKNAKKRGAKPQKKTLFGSIKKSAYKMTAKHRKAISEALKGKKRGTKTRGSFKK